MEEDGLQEQDKSKLILQELRETLQEMKESNGTATEQETASFLLNLINVLEGRS